MISKVFRILLEEPSLWANDFIMLLPGRFGILIRRMWMGYSLSSLGNHAYFDLGTRLWCGKNISIGHKFTLLYRSELRACQGSLKIGDRVSINSNVLIDASADGCIVIGNDVAIGPNVVLRASNHAYQSMDKRINEQGHIGGEIIIEDDVWLAANVVIVPDVKIGAHSIVAAGAVVTKNVESNSVVGGIPARLLFKRS